MLGKLTDDASGKYWYKVLGDVEYALNNTINKSTGEFSSVLLYGIAQRGKIIDEIKECLANESDYEEARNVETIRAKAADKIEKMQEYNRVYTNKKRKKPNEYEEGDLVMVRNFESTPGVSQKLIPAFRGPYQVMKRFRNDRYLVADIDGFQVTQKPYKGVWEVANMRPWRSNDYDPAKINEQASEGEDNSNVDE